MYLLGYDIGSSSIKASLLDIVSGNCLGTAFYPEQEMEIQAIQPGWAEQNPEDWWENLKKATTSVLRKSRVNIKEIKGIGISYQMHGLVVVDKNKKLLRPAIIWCDSRGVSYGEKAFRSLGKEFCLSHLLNSPGNFTASKLAWIKENEPDIFDQIDKIMLPGDYIAMKLSGDITTTLSGLSEGMFWDFKSESLSKELMEYYGFPESIIPTLVPTFGYQTEVNKVAAEYLGLAPGIPITYRAGDQPNNALSLGVLNPGEIASTAGTSGVIYGVNGKIGYDPLSRVNTFAHVNHKSESPRLGILLCINGTGILNSWMRKNIVPDNSPYETLNNLASQVPIGSAELSILPFGNGAERVLQNQMIGASIHGLNFNIHDRRHLLRAAQEGIVFSFQYGIEIMEQMGMHVQTIKAGYSNMFKSRLFRETLAAVSGTNIELYDTDGSVGAAKGAGLGAGIYKSALESFSSLRKKETVEPSATDMQAYQEAYLKWKKILNKEL